MGRPRSVSPRNTGPGRWVADRSRSHTDRASACRCPGRWSVGAPARGLSTNSRLNEANITKTYLKGVNITNAWLYEADLTNAQRLILGCRAPATGMHSNRPTMPPPLTTLGGSWGIRAYRRGSRRAVATSTDRSRDRHKGRRPPGSVATPGSPPSAA
ncbi:pentapeptide repeat-containing protein [Frankia sp. Cas3]|uniref:pentapeptide repeat-containing protein n=1 Tax=Frankia sp. Cas3 TaxID=3073926 RepID=UPI003A10399E